MNAPWVQPDTKLTVHYQAAPPQHVRWGFHRPASAVLKSCPLMVGISEDGQLCRIMFGNEASQKHLIERWRQEWKKCIFEKDEVGTRFVIDSLDGKKTDLKLWIAGTAFQQSVWKAMLKIPVGKTLSYSAVAAQIKRPNAVRAVGTACGANPVPLIVPCHRIVGSHGNLGGFGGGLPLKRRLLEAEGGAFKTGSSNLELLR